jgi:UDP-2,3-diacylglucosamine hydrolase
MGREKRMTKRIAILAGGGTLPLVLARSIVDQGGRAHIVAVRGEAGPQIEAFPHTWVTWGAVNAILATLKRESDNTMMIAGSVSRPDLMRLKPDFGVIRYLPKVLAMLRGGDDAVLTRLVRFFESQGLTVKGVADIAPELIAVAGQLGTAAAPSAATEADIACGFAVLDALSDLDIGQAIVVDRGKILAIEGVEGTDRMLARIATLPGRVTPSGVLVKGPKRGQDLRVDMPAVGAQTIGSLEEAKIATLVLAAGQTLLLERDEMIRRAGDASITIDARVHAAPITNAAAAPKLSSSASTGVMLGRCAPTFHDARDARTAAEVTRRLAAFETGRAAVVVRDHVLAIAAAEGLLPMARRVATLRQWGRGRMARAKGAAAVRFDPAIDAPADLAACIEILASGGIAGIALISPHGAPDIPSDATAMADRHGLFIVALDVTMLRQPTIGAA